ncbi:MAG TPA: hypothetical protein VHN59_18440 [Chitinophagaceae bacterium]|nr:hypothetical protein [Chitinophagaceae bacterium]
MKSRQFLLAALTLPLLFASCKKDRVSYKSELRKSLFAWQAFKANAGNSYRYTVTTSSWVGISSETTVTVNNGVVTQRSYIQRRMAQSPSGQPSTVVAQEWEETGSTLNTHNYGAATITLDEVYKLAREEWLKEREDVTYYFEAKNNGMISTAGYVPNGCADDCFIGITIMSIERL